jgi:hypothetical protein
MKKQSYNRQKSTTTGGNNFLISVYYNENHSWQGVVQWLDTGKKVHFRSEIELMNLIHTAVLSTQSEAGDFRTWEDDHSLKSVR